MIHVNKVFLGGALMRPVLLGPIPKIAFAHIFWGTCVSLLGVVFVFPISMVIDTTAAASILQWLFEIPPSWSLTIVAPTTLVSRGSFFLSLRLEVSLWFSHGHNPNKTLLIVLHQDNILSLDTKQHIDEVTILRELVIMVPLLKNRVWGVEVLESFLNHLKVCNYLAIEVQLSNNIVDDSVIRLHCLEVEEAMAHSCCGYINITCLYTPNLICNFIYGTRVSFTSKYLIFKFRWMWCLMKMTTFTFSWSCRPMSSFSPSQTIVFSTASPLEEIHSHQLMLDSSCYLGQAP